VCMCDSDKFLFHHSDLPKSNNSCKWHVLSLWSLCSNLYWLTDRFEWFLNWSGYFFTVNTADPN
jgi:hypothetical protein